MKKSVFFKFIGVVLSIILLLQYPVAAIGRDFDTNSIVSEYDTSRIIVKYKKDADKNDIKMSVRLSTKELLLSTEKELDSNIDVVDTHNTNSMNEVMDAFNSNTNVEYAVPDYEIITYDYSQEPMISQQWGMLNNGQTINDNIGISGVDINVLPVLENYTGNGVLVGVLDTGIDINNTEISDTIFVNQNEIPNNGIDDDDNGYIDDINGWNFFDDNGAVFNSSNNDNHGTNVSGIIASKNDNNGIIGVAPNVTLVPLKIMSGTTGYTSDAIEAIEYAKSLGVRIINCSWGCSEYNYALKTEMENSNILFICAAGNGGSDSVSYPAAFGIPNIISVGSIDNKGCITDYSSSGSKQDIYAPGTDILTTGCENTYCMVSGTSFSAAFITGVSALICQAVPNITTAELKIAIKNGSSEKGNDKLKVTDACMAVKNALPINFIQNNSRLSSCMRKIDKIITPDIAEILTNFSYWYELEQSEKQTLEIFFNLSQESMNNCSNNGLDLINSIMIGLISKQLNVDVQIIIALNSCFASIDIFDSEMDKLINLNDRIKLSSSELEKIIVLLTKSYSMDNIAKSMIVSRVIGVSIDQTIRGIDEIYDLENTQFNSDENNKFLTMLALYNLNQQTVYDYITENSISPSLFEKRIVEWQKDHNFYIMNNKIDTFSLSSSYESTMSNYNKYDIPYSGSWSYDNISVNKASGKMNLSQSIISLSGRNNLNLDLGLRFDSDACDAVIEATDSVLLSYNYKVIETRVYYGDSNYTQVIEHSTTNSENLDYWKSLNNTKHFDDPNNTTNYYITYIKIQASAIGDLNITEENYYQSKYGLGIGWTFDLPSIEIVGSEKYLHLSGGAKYKLLTDNKLDGYRLNDLELSDATDTEFSSNNIQAEYVLTEIDGKKLYFDYEGNYLGCKDVIGNCIYVYYDAYGLIDKIYDTAGRYIDINYITNSVNNTRSVTLSLVDNDASTSVLLNTINETYYSKIGDTVINNYLLTSITDAAGRTTSYDYDAFYANIYFNQGIGTGESSTVQNSSIVLTGITSPTGSHTQLEY